MNSKISNVWPGTLKKSCVALMFIGFFALAGCGGGGSSEASMDNDLPSPVPGGIGDGGVTPGQNGQGPADPDELMLLPKVSVGSRQFADPNVLLTLTGTVEAATGAEIVRTLWIQVSGHPVDIPSPLSITNLILVPDVNVATQLEFRLVAEDSEGRINSATTAVMVKPVPTFVKVIGGVYTESDGEAVFTIRLNAPSELPVNISYITQDGSADSETDYVFTSGEIVFAPNEVMKEIPVTLIDDAVQEDAESFSLRVTAINGQDTHANVGVVIIRNGTEPGFEQDLQFLDAGPVTMYMGDEYINGLNGEVSSPGTGDIIYSSSNTAVATVNADGLVVGVDIGTATITATKLADDTYLSATASYEVQVVSRGLTPTVSITTVETSDEIDETPDGLSVLEGTIMSINGLATDEEDGELPTAEQVAESETTGLPIESLSWSSDRDGFLGNGQNITVSDLSRGMHTITYSVTDSDGNTGTASFRVLVGNVAYSHAGIETSSSFCSGNDCYSSVNINDSNLSTALGSATSWTNEDGGLPATVDFFFSSPVTIDMIDMFTSETYPISDYNFEYLDGEVFVPLISIEGNTALYRSHAITQVTIDRLRMNVIRGPTTQPNYGRVNEIAIYGTVDLRLEALVFAPQTPAE